MIEIEGKYLLTLSLLLFIMTSTATAAANRLAACPASPNCVSSQATNTAHAIAPLSFSGEPAQAWERLQETLTALKRLRIVNVESRYLHAEVRSLVFRFVDDLEFVLLPDDQLIHVRSASRTGHSDFGVNRRRVERIRKVFAE